MEELTPEQEEQKRLEEERAAREAQFTQVQTPEQAAQPVQEVTPTLGFDTPDQEPQDEEQAAEQAKFFQDEKMAVRQGEIDRIKTQQDEEFGARDLEGNLLYTDDGRVIRREQSTFEKITNSVENIGLDIQKAIPEINIGGAEIITRLLGEEFTEEYLSENVGFNEESIAEELHKIRTVEAKRGETGSISEGFAEGDVGEIVAGMVNGITSVGSSAVINTLSLGGALPVQFTGQYYKDFNEEKAKKEGKTLEQLRAEGRDEIDAPMAFGMVAGLSERFGLGKVGKKLTGLIKSPVGKKIASRLMSGNKEGLTEVFQTGLEAANMAAGRGEDKSDAFIKGIQEDGLESYLQGFVGGATMAGKGQDQQENISKLRKAAAAMRAPIDTNKLEELIGKDAHLKVTRNGTTDPDVIKNIDVQRNAIKQEMKDLIVKGNGLVGKMTEQQIEDTATKADAARAFVAQGKTLTDKFKAGEITQQEYNAAYDGVKLQFEKKKREIAKIAEAAEQQPKVREKDLTTPNAGGIWHTQVKGAIDTAMADPKKSSWDVVSDPKVQNWMKLKVKSAWNKVPEQFKGATTFEDVLTESLYGGDKRGSQSLKGLLDSFKEGKNAKPSTYLLKQIDHKILDNINKLTGQSKGSQGGVSLDTGGLDESGLDVADSGAIDSGSGETVQEANDSNAEVVAARAGISPKLAGEAKQEAEQFIQENNVRPGAKGFEQDTRKRFVDKLKDKVQAEMGKKQDYVDYLTKNAPGIIKQLPKKALAQRRDESQSWAETPPTPQQFLEYMQSGNQTKKKRALAELIAHNIGLKATKDVIDNNGGRDKVIDGFDDAINSLTKLLGDRNSLQSNPLGVPVNLMIGAVRATKLAYQGGMATADAIKAGWETIKEHVDFDKFRRHIEKSINAQSTFLDEQANQEEQDKQQAAQTVQKAINPNVGPGNTKADSDFSKFQKTIEEQEDSFNNQGGNTKTRSVWDDYIKELGYEPVNVREPEQAAAAQAWVQEEMFGRFPRSFFKGAMFSFSNKNYAIFDSHSKQFQPILDATDDSSFSKGEGVDWGSFGPVKYGRATLRTGEAKKRLIKKLGREPSKLEIETFRVKQNKALIDRLEKKPEELKRRNKANMDGFEYMYKQFEEMMATPELRAKNAPFIAAFLKSSANSQDHVNRFAAPFKGYSEKSFDPNDGAVEEHTVPQVAVNRYLFTSALNGTVTENFPNVRQNYFQVQIAESEDGKLKGVNAKGEAFNYKQSMPDGWKPTDNSWARYFNTNVNNQNGGFNADQIFLIEEGKTLAETFKAKPSLSSLQAAPGKFFAGYAKKKPKAPKSDFGKRTGADFRFDKPNDTMIEYVQESIEDLKKDNPGIKESTIRGYVKTNHGEKYLPYVTIKEKADPFAGYAKKKPKPPVEPGKESWRTDRPNDTMIEYVQAGIEDLKNDNPGIKENTIRGYVKTNHGEKYLPYVVTKAQQDVVSEQVGDRFENLIDSTIGSIEKLTGPKGALQANIAAVPLHLIVGGLRATKLAYQGSRNLAQAIESGYSKVKDYMSRQEWADFTGKAIQEVKDKKTGKQVGLQFASENAVKLQQQQDLNDKFNEIIEQASNGEIKKESVVTKASLGKGKSDGMVKSFFKNFFNASNTDDLKGFIYRIIPNKKEGEDAFGFFRENILIPYQRGATAFNAYKANLHDGFKIASKLASRGKLDKTIGNTGFSYNNAVRVALATANGQEIDGLSKAEVDQLLDTIKGDPKLQAYVDKLNDLFDGSFEWDADQINGDLGGELANRADKVKRAEFLQEYQKNSDQVFSPENMNKIEKLEGKEVRENLENMLQRMKSGRNRVVSQDAATNKFLDWVNNSTAMIMALNMKSASLQLLSAFNYWGQGGMGIASSADVKTLWNSDYAKGRRKGLGFDIAANEIADAASSMKGLNSFLKKMRSAGFAPTQVMDSVAIVIFGAKMYGNRLKKYKAEGHPNPEQAAMDDWVESTEESQQSADPSKISKIQAGPLGRIIFAFGNTPFQYARIVKRGIQDIKNGRGNPVKNLQRVAYYGILQSAMFSVLQSALWAGDEDEKEQKAGYAFWGSIQSFLKSLGLGGAVASVGISAFKEFDKGHRADWSKVAGSISPPISKKIKQIGDAMTAFQDEDFLEGGAEATELVFNIPTSRAMTKFHNIQQALSKDVEGADKLLKVFGWSDWALSIDDPRKKKKKRKKSKGYGSYGSYGSYGKKGGYGSYSKKKSPYNRGEMGQALKDGTIEVDPNLSPLEREKTITHEQQHVKDMEENGLDYTDTKVMFKGEEFPRSNGRIKVEGKWKKEGDRSLPWEQRAYAAESNSPLKKDKPKPGTKEWDDTVREGKDFNHDWYENPTTQKLFNEQASRFKGGYGDRKSAVEDTHYDEGHTEGEAEYWRNNYAEEGEHKHNVTVNPNSELTANTVAHEGTHAGAFDYDLGKEALKHLGKGTRTDAYGRYLNGPDEAYANLQGIRQELGLKPDQRDLTAEQLQKLANEKGSEDTKAYIKHFGIDNVSRAHNKTASVNKKKSLKDLYSTNNKNEGYA